MGLKIIVTAGPTNERIDSVMQITNMSTGRLGASIADALLADCRLGPNIEKLWYLSTTLAVKPRTDADALVPVHITDAENLKDKLAILLKSNHVDLVVHSAAVGDYKARYSATAQMLAKEIANELFSVPTSDREQVILNVLKNPKCVNDDSGKMSSYEPDLLTMMDLTPKVINMVKEVSPYTRLIGFKLLDNVSQDHLVDVGTALRKKTKANVIIANDLSLIREGCHKGLFLDKNGIRMMATGKDDIAKGVLKLAKEWLMEETDHESTDAEKECTLRWIVFVEVDKPARWGEWHTGPTGSVYYSGPLATESEVEAFYQLVKDAYPDNNFLDGKSDHEWFLRFTKLRADVSDASNLETLYRMMRACGEFGKCHGIRAKTLCEEE